MLNFANLNDVEFEYLCRDVMERKLKRRLERFGAGKDGGIDLTEDAYKHTIIVQVKYYIKTGAAGLIAALKKELPKVKKLSPKQYYVCCSKELSPQNKSDIFEIFADYMESTKNIITLTEINDFLELAENADILQRHFKLWLSSTTVLTDIMNNDISIDSDALLANIEENVKLFVKTSAFEQALKCLEKNSILIIVGNPGVGKSITSQMLVLHFAEKQYRIRSTTDGTDLAGLKRALNKSPDVKEIILLDDCFGQAYFSMKESQENELLALIRHVNRNPNKRLIMNSRVSIYQEAKERTPSLVKSLEHKEYKAFVLDMNQIDDVEKAKIFYNHLYFNCVPQEYRDEIRKNKNYREIVKHPNYNPRVIEFVCSPTKLREVRASEYNNFILECLNNPQQIWKNEYERRLDIPDRILLTTLYSLTNTLVPLELLKNCYYYRLQALPAIDLSIDHFSQALNRLTESMVKIVDVNGVKMVGAANPSVNDFISALLRSNTAEYTSLVKNSSSVVQLRRLLDETAYQTKLEELFSDGSILSYFFESQNQKEEFIAYYCAVNSIFRWDYREAIVSYLEQLRDADRYEKQTVSVERMISLLFADDFCDYYKLEQVVYDLQAFSEIMERLDLSQKIALVCAVDHLFTGKARSAYIQYVRPVLMEEMEYYCEDVPADWYDVDISSIAEICKYETGRWKGYVDTDAAADVLSQWVEQDVRKEMKDYAAQLPPDIIEDKNFISKLRISVSGCDSLVESYLSDGFDYDDDIYRGPINSDDEVDYIFNR